jgi:hypothetical protein
MPAERRAESRSVQPSFPEWPSVHIVRFPKNHKFALKGIQMKRLNKLIWAVTLCFLVRLTPPAFPQEKWITLFDGGSTDAWRAFKGSDFPSKEWKVEEGALRTVMSGEHVDLMTKEEFQDFELELEWRVSPGGNGGVFCRGLEAGSGIYNTAPEYQVVDDDRRHDGRNPLTSAASLYGLIAPKGKTLRPVGEYNKLRIIASGNHVEHWVNGSRVLEYEWGSQELKELVSHSKFNKFPRFAQERMGHVALQHHGDAVWYRNIRIRRLK